MSAVQHPPAAIEELNLGRGVCDPYRPANVWNEPWAMRKLGCFMGEGLAGALEQKEATIQQTDPAVASNAM